MDSSDQHRARPHLWRTYVAAAAAVLLILAMGVHSLSAFSEAVGALGAVMNHDARYDPLSASYRTWFAIGAAASAATVISMIVWLRRPGRIRPEVTDPGRLSDFTNIATFSVGLPLVGALISAVGYIFATEAAADHAGET
jgi:O-antigen/teichoic acid export membrane protein